MDLCLKIRACVCVCVDACVYDSNACVCVVVKLLFILDTNFADPVCYAKTDIFAYKLQSGPSPPYYICAAVFCCVRADHTTTQNIKPSWLARRRSCVWTTPVSAGAHGFSHSTHSCWRRASVRSAAFVCFGYNSVNVNATHNRHTVHCWTFADAWWTAAA